jgi:pimeloyl-ACP methyl ester carboxylesterase
MAIESRSNSLSRRFKLAAAVGVMAAVSSGCTTIPWDGSPGLGEERIHEPKLDFDQLRENDVYITPASKTINKGMLTKIDNFIHSKDKFSVHEINFRGSMGSRETAYLTLPKGDGPHPLVTIYPILEGTPEISEVYSKEFARRGYATLVVGGYPLRLREATNAEDAMLKFNYTIKDGRALVDFLKDRTDIDETRLGVTGISLGAIISATVMGVDPEVDAGAFVLGGGGLAEILHDSQQGSIVEFRDNFVGIGAAVLTAGASLGGAIVREEMSESIKGDGGSFEDFKKNIMDVYNIDTKEDFIRVMTPFTEPVDPSRYAGSLDPCRTILISGKYDDVIPPERSEELWERLGRPEWRKLPSDHVPILYFYYAINKSIDLFDRVIRQGVCDKDIEAGNNDVEKSDSLPQSSYYSSSEGGPTLK